MHCRIDTFSLLMLTALELGHRLGMVVQRMVAGTCGKLQRLIAVTERHGDTAAIIGASLRRACSMSEYPNIGLYQNHILESITK